MPKTNSYMYVNADEYLFDTLDLTQTKWRLRRSCRVKESRRRNKISFADTVEDDQLNVFAGKVVSLQCLN